MKRTWIVALALLSSMAITASTYAQTIAIASPAKIFNEMLETKDLKEKLESEGKKINDQLKVKEEELKSMSESLKVLTPGAPQYYESRKALIQKAIELDTWKKVTQAQTQESQKYQMKLLFDKISDAVKAIAIEDKIDLVIAESNVEFPEMDQINVDQLRGLINQRNVIYSSGKLDISSKVTAKLDADYKKASDKK